jgi:glycolate oxidase
MTGSLEERFQNLHEFVTQARTNLYRNNWDYLIGGSETETTLARNRAALDAYGFRPRVLRDVSNVDCSRAFFGKKLRIPCFARPSAGSRCSSRVAAPPSPQPPASSATE